MNKQEINAVREIAHKHGLSNAVSIIRGNAEVVISGANFCVKVSGENGKFDVLYLLPKGFNFDVFGALVGAMPLAGNGIYKAVETSVAELKSGVQSAVQCLVVNRSSMEVKS